MKKELLSPAGNFLCLKQAIHNGCDAVYLGGKKFGARAFADNFNDEEMVAAIEYCHLYGVKIYVTINTMIYESEIEECISYIRFLHQNNVDALIMQDLGLIKIVRETFPNMEIHASTQLHAHNQEQLKLLENLGIKRVVIARECSLDEIQSFDTSMEIEVFIHGALCVSYSGQCLFSSLLLDRSGNRGSCAGICRLPFEFVSNHEVVKTKGNYLLSTKELNTMDYFQELMKSNITSFKIEGRMKSPEYVGYITKLYRMLMDCYEKNEPLQISEKQKENLMLLYNRGFTKGFLFHASNEELMNIETSNHQGIDIGVVLAVNKDKIKMKLSKELTQGDGIRFKEEDQGFIVNYLYDEKGLLIHHADANCIVFVDNKIHLDKKCRVLKTIDSKLMQELEKIEEKKIPIVGKVIAKIGKPLKISFQDEEFLVAATGKIVEKSLKNPTTKEVIKDKINQLGNSPFVMTSLEIEQDEDIFLPMSELKSLRRILLEDLIEKRKKRVPHLFQEKERKEIKKLKNQKTANLNLHVLARTEEQIEACLEEKVESIYVTNEVLYQKYKHYSNIYLRLSRVKKEFQEKQNENLLIGEVGSLFKYHSQNLIVTDYYLNVSNCAYFQYLEEFGVKRITLSIENTLETLKDLCKSLEHKEKIELFLYGRPEVMAMKYCPLHLLVNQDKICHVCKNKNQYYLKDRNEKYYPILSEVQEQHLTHILYYKTIDHIENLKEYQELGIENYRIELWDETKEEVKNLICKLK